MTSFKIRLTNEKTNTDKFMGININEIGNRVFINIENKFINFMGYFLYNFYKEIIYED